MNPFVKFMMSTAGRIARILVGLTLIIGGFWGGAGTVVGIIGFVPLLAGLVNFCLVAPLFGVTLMGGKPKAS